jgi:hypothetical protein
MIYPPEIACAVKVAWEQADEPFLYRTGSKEAKPVEGLEMPVRSELHGRPCDALPLNGSRDRESLPTDFPSRPEGR